MEPTGTQPPGEPRTPPPNISERSVAEIFAGLAEQAYDTENRRRAALLNAHVEQIDRETPERMRQAQMRE